MFDVTALGELLIDFTPSGKSEAGRRLFEQNPGGAPANVLAALNRCGLKTAFIGKVGQDMHGRFDYRPGGFHHAGFCGFKRRGGKKFFFCEKTGRRHNAYGGGCEFRSY